MPSAVGELAQSRPVSRSAVSQHLKVLKEAGLVCDEASAPGVSIASTGGALADLRAYFQAFWDQALAGFRDHAERADGDSPGHAAALIHPANKDSEESDVDDHHR